MQGTILENLIWIILLILHVQVKLILEVLWIFKL